MAVAVADGARNISEVAVLEHQPALFGAVRQRASRRPTRRASRTGSAASPEAGLRYSRTAVRVGRTGPATPWERGRWPRRVVVIMPLAYGASGAGNSPLHDESTSGALLRGDT